MLKRYQGLQFLQMPVQAWWLMQCARPAAGNLACTCVVVAIWRQRARSQPSIKHRCNKQPDQGLASRKAQLLLMPDHDACRLQHLRPCRLLASTACTPQLVPLNPDPQGPTQDMPRPSPSCWRPLHHRPSPAASMLPVDSHPHTHLAAQSGILCSSRGDIQRPGLYPPLACSSRKWGTPSSSM